MQINLIELEHQKDAINHILSNLPDDIDYEKTSKDYFQNPILLNSFDESHFIDIKMETGTGKTYVYTRTMYELHKKFGLFKFIIVVPSVAIKEGTKNFITSDYAIQHFKRFFPNIRLELYTINKGDFAKKKGRKVLPSSFIQFCSASRNDKNTIHCLLISDIGYLNSISNVTCRNKIRG